jgi:signal transduction histidine kinase
VSDATRIVTDLNGRVLEAADGAAQLFAIDGRWLEGKPLAAFVVPEEVRAFRTLVLELAHGNGPLGTSLRLQRRDGVHVEVKVEAVAESHGDRLEWLFASPLPAEEEPRAQLAPLEGRPLQRLLGRLPLGVVSIDRELTIEYVNPAARVFLRGARVGGMLPEPLSPFSLRKFAQRLFASTPPPRRVVESSTGRLFEIDGIPGGERESALLLLQDVTAHERRRRAEREFAANAAHELRTPIAAITSSLDVLEGGAKDVPDDRDLFLGHIERETARLARLVDALLLLARIQTGQAQPSLALVDVGPLLESVAEQLEPQEDVVVRIECVGEVAMLADADLLRQAVWNLAANAVGHTRAGEVCLTGRDLGAMAEIEVRDTGTGISAEERAQVFDRFFRANRRIGKGFGLGLPISQEIAHALGGSVTLESEPGVGTRVRVHLPSARLVA